MLPSPEIEHAGAKSPQSSIHNANKTDGPRSRRGTSLPSLDDGRTVDGVLKRTTYMHHLSVFRTGPRYSLGTRRLGLSSKSFAPPPGTYEVSGNQGNKFRTVPQYSFGPAKKQPGPGAYDPSDPTDVAAKIGFVGRNARSGFATSGSAPAQPKSRSHPGLGANEPNHDPNLGASLKTGMGRGTRDDPAAQARKKTTPAPGSYELQNFHGTGSGGPRYSFTARRSMQDPRSHLEPGPGAYNAHITSFIEDKQEPPLGRAQRSPAHVAAGGNGRH